MSQLTIEKIGRRLYVAGNSYPVKDCLKQIGCKWDADRKQWWIGSGKQAELEGCIGKADRQPAYREPTKEELGDKPCKGKVEYKGRQYYVIGHSQAKGKLWLTVLDCSINFWALESECKWTKRYEAREVWDGRRYSNSTVTQYQTVAGIRRFIERAKSDPASIKPSPTAVRCRHCNEWTEEGDDWCTACGKADYER